MLTVVTSIGGLLGVYLTFAAAVEWWPFEGPPEVRIDIAASRVNSAGSDNPTAEYICLVNKGDGSTNLLGWTLRDAEHQVNVLPDVTLDSGQRIRIHPGEGTESSTDVYGKKGTAAWNNEGDTVALLDDSGDEIDSQTYGQIPESSTASCVSQ